MINLEYHKGSFCVYSTIFCQEGYCSECGIYLRKLSSTGQVKGYVGKPVSLKPRRVLQEVGVSK